MQQAASKGGAARLLCKRDDADLRLTADEEGMWFVAPPLIAHGGHRHCSAAPGSREHDEKRPRVVGGNIGQQQRMIDSSVRLPSFDTRDLKLVQGCRGGAAAAFVWPMAGILLVLPFTTAPPAGQLLVAAAASPNDEGEHEAGGGGAVFFTCPRTHETRRSSRCASASPSHSVPPPRSVLVRAAEACSAGGASKPAPQEAAALRSAQGERDASPPARGLGRRDCFAVAPRRTHLRVLKHAAAIGSATAGPAAPCASGRRMSLKSIGSPR